MKAVQARDSEVKMTFINEDIPDDLRQKFNIEPHKRTWTADYENNCFLLNIANREDITLFYFYYNNICIEVGTTKHYKVHTDTNLFIEYNVENIYIHQVPIEKKMDIEQKLTAALQEYCLYCEKLSNSTVTVDFSTAYWAKSLYTDI